MDKEKQAMYLEDWHAATEQMNDFLDSLVALAGEGRAFTVEALVSAYGKAQEQATMAMLKAGFEDCTDKFPVAEVTLKVAGVP